MHPSHQKQQANNNLSTSSRRGHSTPSVPKTEAPVAAKPTASTMDCVTMKRPLVANIIREQINNKSYCNYYHRQHPIDDQTGGKTLGYTVAHTFDDDDTTTTIAKSNRFTRRTHTFSGRLGSIGMSIGPLMVASFLIELALGQCPWPKDYVDLHSDCICDFNPPHNHLNRISIQCSPVNMSQLIEALSSSASVPFTPLLNSIGSPPTSQSNPISSFPSDLMSYELSSLAKIDMLHINNSTIRRLYNNMFLLKDNGSGVIQNRGPNSSYHVLLDGQKEQTLTSLTPGESQVIAIQSLHISRSGIETIEDGAFIGLEPHLISLSLQDNMLEVVPYDALNRLNNLKVLDLSNNNIVHIRGNAFVRLNHLNTLRLADNKFHINGAISNQAFVGLEGSLNDLNLKNTQLSLIPVSIRHLEKLAFLNLAQNQISHIPAKMFRHMKSLTAVNLERNRISVIDDDTFFGVESTLSSLSLLGNLIEEFPQKEISKLTKIRRLDMGFNGMKRIPDDTFSKNTILNLVALDGNPLETLPESAFRTLNNTLRGLSIGGRSLICDCRLSWILRWQRDYKLQITSRDRQPQFCAKPQYLRSLISFASLLPEHLTCLSTMQTPFKMIGDVGSGLVDNNNNNNNHSDPSTVDNLLEVGSSTTSLWHPSSSYYQQHRFMNRKASKNNGTTITATTFGPLSQNQTTGVGDLMELGSNESHSFSTTGSFSSINPTLSSSAPNLDMDELSTLTDLIDSTNSAGSQRLTATPPMDGLSSSPGAYGMRTSVAPTTSFFSTVTNNPNTASTSATEVGSRSDSISGSGSLFDDALFTAGEDEQTGADLARLGDSTLDGDSNMDPGIGFTGTATSDISAIDQETNSNKRKSNRHGYLHRRLGSNSSNFSSSSSSYHHLLQNIQQADIARRRQNGMNHFNSLIFGAKNNSSSISINNNTSTTAATSNSPVAILAGNGTTGTTKGPRHIGGDSGSSFSSSHKYSISVSSSVSAPSATSSTTQSMASNSNNLPPSLSSSFNPLRISSLLSQQQQANIVSSAASNENPIIVPATQNSGHPLLSSVASTISSNIIMNNTSTTQAPTLQPEPSNLITTTARYYGSTENEPTNNTRMSVSSIYRLSSLPGLTPNLTSLANGNYSNVRLLTPQRMARPPYMSISMLAASSQSPASSSLEAASTSTIAATTTTMATTIPSPNGNLNRPQQTTTTTSNSKLKLEVSTTTSSPPNIVSSGDFAGLATNVSAASLPELPRTNQHSHLFGSNWSKAPSIMTNQSSAMHQHPQPTSSTTTTTTTAASITTSTPPVYSVPMFTTRWPKRPTLSAPVVLNSSNKSSVNQDQQVSASSLANEILNEKSSRHPVRPNENLNPPQSSSSTSIVASSPTLDIQLPSSDENLSQQLHHKVNNRKPSARAEDSQRGSLVPLFMNDSSSSSLLDQQLSTNLINSRSSSDDSNGIVGMGSASINFGPIERTKPQQSQQSDHLNSPTRTSSTSNSSLPTQMSEGPSDDRHRNRQQETLGEDLDNNLLLMASSNNNPSLGTSISNNSISTSTSTSYHQDEDSLSGHHHNLATGHFRLSFGRLGSLTDFDQMAIIVAGTLCLIIVTVAISFVCCCYRRLRLCCCWRFRKGCSSSSQSSNSTDNSSSTIHGLSGKMSSSKSMLLHSASIVESISTQRQRNLLASLAGASHHHHHSAAVRDEAAYLSGTHHHHGHNSGSNYNQTIVDTIHRSQQAPAAKHYQITRQKSGKYSAHLNETSLSASSSANTMDRRLMTLSTTTTASNLAAANSNHVYQQHQHPLDHKQSMRMHQYNHQYHQHRDQTTAGGTLTSKAPATGAQMYRLDEDWHQLHPDDDISGTDGGGCLQKDSSYCDSTKSSPGIHYAKNNTNCETISRAPATNKNNKSGLLTTAAPYTIPQADYYESDRSATSSDRQLITKKSSNGDHTGHHTHNNRSGIYRSRSVAMRGTHDEFGSGGYNGTGTGRLDYYYDNNGQSYGDAAKYDDRQTAVRYHLQPLTGTGSYHRASQYHHANSFGSITAEPFNSEHHHHQQQQQPIQTMTMNRRLMNGRSNHGRALFINSNTNAAADFYNMMQAPPLPQLEATPVSTSSSYFSQVNGYMVPGGTFSGNAGQSSAHYNYGANQDGTMTRLYGTGRYLGATSNKPYQPDITSAMTDGWSSDNQVDAMYVKNGQSAQPTGVSQAVTAAATTKYYLQPPTNSSSMAGRSAGNQFQSRSSRYQNVE